MKSLLAALTLNLSLIGAAAASSFGPLVEPADLSAALNSVNPVLLDIRAKGYEEGHVAGAISAPYGLFRGPKNNPGQLFNVEELETNLEQIGLDQDEPIVIISAGTDSSDFGAAARVYWTLKSTGFTDLAILNGGQAAWKTAGLPINANAVSTTPSALELEFDPRWSADTADVSNVVTGKSKGVLVDARLTPFYHGKKAHPAAKQPGTLPGAVNQPFTAFFKGDKAAISRVGDVAGLKSTLGITEGNNVISFCNTGHWAATHWFATSELAGIENAKLYAGSMVEYSQAALPMENTPGLFQNLISQIFGN